MGAGKRVSDGLAALLFYLLVAALAACSPAAETPAGDAAGEIIDIRGRAIAIDTPVSRIAIDDSRYLVALSLIHPEPVSALAAWGHDVNRLGDATYQGFLTAAPQLADLPRIASSAENFDVESLIAARPDAAILSVESGVTDAQIARVEAAGIPVVILDFFADPMNNLEPSLLLLGELTGRSEQARAFITFRQQRMERIASRLADLPDEQRPLVFLEAHAGGSPDCCNSPGKGNASDYLAFVGGHNIGADAISQSSGRLNIEYVISRDPDVYIATGGPHLASSGGMDLGAGYSPAQARAALERVAARRGIATLSAVRDGRAFGFSHQLLNSPVDIVAIETFAKWLHPELFADLDPAATLAEINSRFLTVPYEGTYWISLKP